MQKAKPVSLRSSIIASGTLSTRFLVGFDTKATWGELVNGSILDCAPEELRGKLDPVPFRRMMYARGAEACRDAALLLAADDRGADMDAALAEAAAGRAVTPGKRTDLRAVPLVTIDGEDARDDEVADDQHREIGRRVVGAIEAVLVAADRTDRRHLQIADEQLALAAVGTSVGQTPLEPGQERTLGKLAGHAVES